MIKIAVLVPGIMGSELYLGNELIWPGPLQSLVFPFPKMKELQDPNLVAKDVIRTYATVSSQYDSLIQDLAVCGYREFPAAHDPKTLIVFPYDWRKANEDSAVGLARRLDNVVDDARRRGETAEISLIAHSMGGLISRYYLESGQFNGTPGFSAIRNLITIGTPHRGAPIALSMILGQERELFLSPAQVKQLAADPNFPSAYQLLPPASEPFVWDESSKAAYNEFDIYSPANAADLGLSLVNLAAAQKFHKSLATGQRPTAVRYFCFAGSRQTTAAISYALRSGPGKIRLRKVEVESGGDGTVPIWSSSLPAVQGRPVGGEHGTLYKNRDLRRILGSLLGKPGLLAAKAGGIEVAVRDRVVVPLTPFRLVLTLDPPSTSLTGILSIQKVIPGAPGQVAYQPVGSNLSLDYRGPTADSLELTLNAPAVNGPYRVFYNPSSPPVSSDSGDDLFVQL